jgi:hypothetical protein
MKAKTFQKIKGAAIIIFKSSSASAWDTYLVISMIFIEIIITN